MLLFDVLGRDKHLVAYFKQLMKVPAVVPFLVFCLDLGKSLFHVARNLSELLVASDCGGSSATSLCPFDG